MTISLCMICRDNKDTIEAALKSTEGVFDEIIIVDTGSVDGTLEIVKKYTEKTYQIEWEDDFAKARNYSLDKATSDLIFWMDSDDTLPEETRNAIRGIAQDNNPNAAYMFKIHNIYGFDFAHDWLNDYRHLKLFPNRKDIRFNNTVLGYMHEGVVDSVMALPIEIRSVDFSIIHHGYETEEMFTKKIMRDIRICMNKKGQYYQFRIGECFFVFHGNELSLWKSIYMTNDISQVDLCYCSFTFQEDSFLSIPQKTEIHQRASELYLKQEKQINMFDQLQRLQKAIENCEKGIISNIPEMEVAV